MKLRMLAGALAAIGLVIAPAPAIAASQSERNERIDDYLDEYAEENQIEGLAAAVIGPDGVEYEQLSGKDGDGAPIREDTPFLIGSVAKTMTATIVMMLADERRLSLDDQVSDHIGFLPEGDPTIEQLLTHTSGFSSADGIAASERFDNEPGSIRRAVESLEHSGMAGDYAYTSADYLVLGAIVESLTGRAYGDVLEATLLDPLGMDDSAADADGAAGLPPGHRLWWGRPFGYDPGFDGSGTPYGSVTSTLTDLESYATAQLRGDIIRADLRDQMQQPQVDASDDRYGFGWSITDIDDERIVHHTGANPGYFAHVLMVPERQYAVVIMANTYSEARAQSLAAGAEDVWRIANGEDRQPVGGDMLLMAAPWILAVIAVLGLGLAVLSLRRPVRRARRFAAAAVCAITAVVLWKLPGFVGYDLRALGHWMPDMAWSLKIGVALWGIAMALFAFPPALRRGRVAEPARSSTENAG